MASKASADTSSCSPALSASAASSLAAASDWPSTFPVSTDPSIESVSLAEPLSVSVSGAASSPSTGVAVGSVSVVLAGAAADNALSFRLPVTSPPATSVFSTVESGSATLSVVSVSAVLSSTVTVSAPLSVLPFTGVSSCLGASLTTALSAGAASFDGVVVSVLAGEELATTVDGVVDSVVVSALAT